MPEEEKQPEGGKKDSLTELIYQIIVELKKLATNNDDKGKILEVLSEQLKQQGEDLNAQQLNIENQQANLKKHQKEIKQLGSQIKEQRHDYIQYFGIFVAIFTAISIDIQLLKFAQNAWTISGLILMINTAPLLFFWFIRTFLTASFMVDEAIRAMQGGESGRESEIQTTRQFLFGGLGRFLLHSSFILGTILLLIGVGAFLIQKGAKYENPQTVIERVESHKTEVIEKEEGNLLVPSPSLTPSATTNTPTPAEEVPQSQG